ncbi:aminoglycoside phosphotransferase family protein [Streptomyces sp. NPDC088387]|uniref:aminoglycoside phosphotransferase family protein n=1 Tax=Streptomyces sp. NPDC088387 TaxID=3365859 RepID=UPI00382A68AF
MGATRMHNDEVDIDTALVERLVAAQFPRWAGLPVTRLVSSGTENAMFRLGPELVVRLPRHPRAVDAIDHELTWLDRLGPALDTPVPRPVGRGGPGAGFGWPWGVYGWLEGRNPMAGAVEDPAALAAGLADFVTALRRVDAVDGPPSSRGGPLSGRDGPTRAALARLSDRMDTTELTRMWEEALRVPGRTGPPVWAHGDLSPGNVLVRDGRLGAVLDFGVAGVGDPAVDLVVAWNLLPASVRDGFREAVGAGDEEWARARGWALSISLIQLPYYWDTNPALAENSRHVIAEILAEQHRTRVIGDGHSPA